MRDRNSARMQCRRGFSMIELLIVIAVGLIVTTTAIPAITTTLANVRMRASMSSLSGVLQSTRMVAVKENKTKQGRFTIDRGGLVVHIKDAGDLAGLLSTDVQVQLEAPIVKYPTPSGAGAPTAFTTAFLGYTPSAANPAFNSRGLPCLFSGGGCPSRGFVFYFKDTRRQSSEGWAAISISPAGRITKWFWTGAAWVN
jgi:prepilin-type N-terminal cleavage/methylation domain-containing protein